MKKYFVYPLLFVVLFCSCGTGKTDQPEQPDTHETGDAHEEDPNIAELTDEQVKTIGIQLGAIEEKQLTSALKTNGVLRVPNQNKAAINSLYSGVIRSLLVQPGNFVKKGQAIATVANPDFIQVQSELIGVRSKIQLAELEVNRQRELNKGNAGALKNLQSAESELRTLRTMQSTLSQQVRLMGVNPDRLADGKLVSVLSITSPISGVVSNVAVKMGSYVDLSTVVAEVVDNSSLHLDLFVYEKDLPKLKNNQTIHFAITNNAVKEYDAKIFSLGSSFEGASKAVTVHAMVEGDKTGLIDGMNVTAVISLEKATVPAVPAEAIVNVAGQDYIFVKVQDSAVHKGEEGMIRFERVAVAKGGSDIGYTEITTLKEVAANAQVVTKGAFFVSAKMTNTEGHSH
ncbi:MAG: efflux RND transporter periplasmic adaptor subunit [Chitinophagaceae bacterium]|nr:MAG: efflux RND transporter periplasmic adaptor subunit [Chitinophagaceae bacterium]